MKIEKIFEVLTCTNNQKATYATYMLVGEAEHWWRGARALLCAQRVQLTWDDFKATFLEKYFPKNVRIQKEVEFLQLKQENMTIDQYTAKFDELAKFSTYLRGNPDEIWKSIKYESS